MVGASAAIAGMVVASAEIDGRESGEKNVNDASND
jgi:hypothetical protein